MILPDRLRRRRQTLHTSLVVSLSLLIFYFTAMLLFGPRGLLAEKDLRRENLVLSDRLVELSAQRKLLERIETSLRHDGADPDVIEEHIRAVLGYGHIDDRVVFFGVDRDPSP